MREYCRKKTCDGLIDIPKHVEDFDIVKCEKCGAEYEVHTEMWLVPVEIKVNAIQISDQ